MRGFNVWKGYLLVGYADTYRVAKSAADYRAKRDGVEIRVESPNGTLVYRVGGR